MGAIAVSDCLNVQIRKRAGLAEIISTHGIDAVFARIAELRAKGNNIAAQAIESEYNELRDYLRFRLRGQA
ncbi:hypothetical protein [Nocardia transvalensis]|uniref:hypothetical protein n=1 Tax=Nocardia transvalensis TaxID=37333 RepID=UPI0018951874|nr:hypothetical protein [Nocardia transvalensis]MBF6332481.1 hypothetical protein [Nocardia transvalensis]